MLDRATTLLDLMEGRRRAERGMEAAGSTQPDARETFRDEAYTAIATLARTQEFIFVDDLVGALSVEPPHPNCWGGVWRQAIDRKLIERTSMVRPTAQPKKNHHNYPVYRSLVFNPA